MERSIKLKPYVEFRGRVPQGAPLYCINQDRAKWWESYWDWRFNEARKALAKLLEEKHGK